MRKLKIIEHMSLDGVVQHSADDNDFPYSEWTVPYRSPAGRDAMLAAHGEGFDLLLGRRTYDLWSGFWPTGAEQPDGGPAQCRNEIRRDPPPGQPASGARARALAKTLSRAFAGSNRATARTSSSWVAPR